MVWALKHKLPLRNDVSLSQANCCCLPLLQEERAFWSGIEVAREKKNFRRLGYLYMHDEVMRILDGSAGVSHKSCFSRPLIYAAPMLRIHRKCRPAEPPHQST